MLIRLRRPLACFLICSSLPAAAAASARDALRVERLDNGLTLVLKEDHSQPIVAVCISVNGGGRTESDDLKGLSHYYEHTVFRGGTATQAESETRKRFRELGTFYGFTSNDCTAYYIVTPVENFKEAFTRYTDALMNLEVTEEKIEKDRQTVLQELHMRYSDLPAGRSWFKLWQTAFTKHPYRTLTIGTEQVITNSKLDKFRTFFKERYVPNQMYMSVVGDFVADEMIQLARTRMGGYPRGKESFELGIQEPEQEAFRESIEEKDCELSYIHIGFKIPGAAHPDTEVLHLIGEILSGGRGSRLEEALQVQNNIVLSHSATASDRKDPSLFVIGLSADPAMEARAVEATLEELWRLTIELVTEDELARAKRRLLSRKALEDETFEEQAMELSWYALLGDPGRRQLGRKLIERATAAEIRDVARRVFHSKGCSLSVVRPSSDGANSSYASLAARILPAGVRLDRKLETASPSGILETQLPSGMRLAVIRGPSEGVAAICAVIEGGTRIDPEGREGISHMVTRLATRGAGDLGSKEMAKQLDALGCTVSESSGHDYSEISLECPSGAVRDALELVLAMLFSPRFEAEQVEKVREETLSAIDAIKDSPFDLTDQIFMEKAYGDSPYGRSPLGTRASVEGLTVEALRAHHAAYWLPANVVVSVAGDVAPEAVQAKVSNLMAPFDNAPVVTPVIPVAVAKAKIKSLSESSLLRPSRQITFNMGAPTVAVTADDYLPMKLAASILGNRLFFRYVYEEGLAYRMWTLLPERKGLSPFYFQMGVAPEHYLFAKEGILSEVGRFIGSELTDEEVAGARASIIQSFKLSQRKSIDRARRAALFTLWGFGASYLDLYPMVVEEISGSDILTAARKHLGSDKFFLVRVGPEPSPEGQEPEGAQDKPVAKKAAASGAEDAAGK